MSSTYFFVSGISGATLTLINRCSYTVWPGILANAGSSPLGSTGFELPSGGSRSFQAPPNWSGRFWGRTGCTFDPTTGQGSCLTGDCSTNQIECNGQNAKPPATLAEFTIGSSTQDFYDVSLVDGYNLPMIVEPNGGSAGSCLSTGCVTDLNEKCPAELRDGSGEACKSACEAFGSPEYCCSGAYATPDTCRPSVYSQMFKAACPRAYSYAYDDPTSTFTCTGADYVITFCPSLASQKSARDTSPPAASTATGSDESGSGDEESNGIDTSWLPSFFTGRSSSGGLSCSSCPLRLISSIFSIIFLCFLY
ncbi:Thaumatin-like protein 1 [Turnera subulata]|uniref:Thaumatin-like protein 1 n=1 Tax=Turnera subulata TaxID=218843 RepID=A0A9Q0FIJ0_9ROSI|nr:Thaumatin-like protein 1 [Turnera subulata]